MRIACPACAAEYEVPENRVPPGKVVRCARCEADWIAVAMPMVAAVQREIFAPMPPPKFAVVPEERYVEQQPERGHPAVAIAWVLSLALLAAAAWGAYARRAEVVRAWPASERAYLALGIPVRS